MGTCARTRACARTARAAAACSPHFSSQLRDEAAQSLPAMAQLILLGCRQFSDGDAALRQLENRIVAKAAAASRRYADAPFPACLADQWKRIVPPAHVDERTAVARCTFRWRASIQRD